MVKVVKLGPCNLVELNFLRDISRATASLLADLYPLFIPIMDKIVDLFNLLVVEKLQLEFFQVNSKLLVDQLVL